jgi:hypothetical protein
MRPSLRQVACAVLFGAGLMIGTRAAVIYSVSALGETNAIEAARIG